MGAGAHRAGRGVARQDHYGSGRQPWDDILDAGWAPEFAAGNVLKYLRCDKARAYSVESARWYYRRLKEMFLGSLAPAGWEPRDQCLHAARAAGRLSGLERMLTAEEIVILTGDDR